MCSNLPVPLWFQKEMNQAHTRNVLQLAGSIVGRNHDAQLLCWLLCPLTIFGAWRWGGGPCGLSSANICSIAGKEASR